MTDFTDEENQAYWGRRNNVETFKRNGKKEQRRKPLRGQGEYPDTVVARHSHPDWPPKGVSNKAKRKGSRRARRLAA